MKYAIPAMTILI